MERTVLIKYSELENNIRKGKIENCYIFCGCDEQLMKESIAYILKRTVSKDLLSLNYIQLDGSTVTYDDMVNACETLPFMSDKKVIVIYRAEFLEDSRKKKKSSDSTGEDQNDSAEDRENDSADKSFSQISKYLVNIPPYCILIIYQVLNDDRDKPSSKVQRLDKKLCVVKFDKLKGEILEKKVKEYFEEKGKNIGRPEIKLFCDLLDNNMETVKNEVEKLCCYTESNEIKKEDILSLLPQKTDNDIFDLVDFISQRRYEKAISIMNELIYKGENLLKILYMIERQFKLLMNIKIELDRGKSCKVISKELSLNPYICEKMAAQSRKFTKKQVIKAVDLCLSTEEKLKSTGVNAKTEMELLIINAVS